MKKEHLINFFPFLSKEFRKIEVSEITSEAVFKELFPDDEVIDFSKLNAVYHYQNEIFLEPLNLPPLPPVSVNIVVDENGVQLFDVKQTKPYKKNGKV